VTFKELRRRTPLTGEEMAKSQRHGNREARKPKAAKPLATALVSPFATKAAPAAAVPPKRKG
jgi:hypothetical protein